MGVWEAPPLPVRGAGTAKPVFVGRAAETAALEQAWAAVRSGERQLVFLGGEPGAGKSRLVEESAAAMYRGGAVVLTGTCSPEPGGPYQPFVECLEQLLGGTAEGGLADCLPDSAAELLRLTPLVWRHRPGLQSPPGDAGDYRRELFDALTALLQAVSRDRPVVCILEDLHWAGVPTLQLLEHVTHRSAHSRLLLLGTHRTTAPDRSDRLTFAIADLYRLDGVRRLDLAGLSTDEIAQYLVTEGGLGVRRAREYATVLRDQTGGNPFFLREVWRDLAVRDGSAPVRSLAAPAPVSVRDTLQRRLARLTSAERDVLETAAVLGDGEEVATLVAASPGEAAEVLGAVDTAVRFGLVAPDELASGRVGFPHMLTRQAVLDLIAPSRRVLLHARIAEVLEASGSESPRVVRQLAHHFARASALGYRGKAAEYLVLSARQADRSLAFEDAAAWYEQAADQLDGQQQDAGELRFAAARSLVRAGDFARARSLYRKLSESPDAAVRLRAAVGFEDAGWRPGLPGGEACELLSHALSDLPADPASAGYVHARASLGRAMAFTGDLDRAGEVAEQALADARRQADDRLLLHVLSTMMWHATDPSSLDRQLSLAEELGALARANGAWEDLGTAAVFRSAITYMRGDMAGWRDAIADEDLAVRHTGQPFMAYMRGCIDYTQALLRGEFAAAEQAAEDLVELGRSFGPDDTEGPYGLQMFVVRRETGALEAVRPLIDVSRPAEGSWEPGLLALYTELELTGAARDLLWRLLDQLETAPARHSPWAQWTAVLVFLAEAAVAQRDEQAARRLRPLLAPYTGLQLLAGTFIAVFGPADGYLAGLDSVLGDDDSADLLFERAVEQCRAVGSVVHRATALAMQARHLRSVGAPPRRVAQVIQEARRLAEQTGQVRVLRLLEDLAESPVGLTAREMEVLRLLVQGTSNRDIARKLRITENTAANHVRSILIKTGAANRTQVAMMAVSRRWVDGAPGGPQADAPGTGHPAGGGAGRPGRLPDGRSCQRAVRQHPVPDLDDDIGRQARADSRLPDGLRERRLVQAVRLPLVGREEGVQPAHALLLVDPVDPVGDLCRRLEVLCEPTLDHKNGHNGLPRLRPFTVQARFTSRKASKALPRENGPRGATV